MRFYFLMTFPFFFLQAIGYHYMIVPGMGGSVLLDKLTHSQVWPPLNPFRLHEISKIELDNDQVLLHKTGDLKSIRLSNYWTSLITKNSYYDRLIDTLLSYNKRVHALPYDFRKIHTKDYKQNLFREYKLYIESRSEKTILINHSLGGILVYEFLKSVDKNWIDKHIEHVFFICVPFGGTVEALHCILTNDINISNISLRLRTLRYFGGFYVTLPINRNPIIRYNGESFTMGKEIFEIFGLSESFDIYNQYNYDRTQQLGIQSTLIISDNVLTKSLIDMDNPEESVLVRGDGLVTGESLLFPLYHWTSPSNNLVRIPDTDHGKICENKKTISKILDY